jgi:hypothetical protein
MRWRQEHPYLFLKRTVQTGCLAGVLGVNVGYPRYGFRLEEGQNFRLVGVTCSPRMAASEPATEP